MCLNPPLGLEQIRAQVSTMEMETRRFYERAAARTQDPGIRQLLDDLAAEETTHVERAAELEKKELKREVREKEDTAKRRLFVLQIVQPGLADLMDGSVATLAPVFAAAFATKNTWDAFAVGLAASLGAGISMGFAEALSDDGSLTGRGTPWIRGLITGSMTALWVGGPSPGSRAARGGIGHPLPYLMHNFNFATTVAILVVIIELAAITWV